MNQHVLAFKLDTNLCSRPGGEETPNALPQPSHREMPGMATLNVAPSECAPCVLHSSPYTLPTRIPELPRGTRQTTFLYTEREEEQVWFLQPQFPWSHPYLRIAGTLTTHAVLSSWS